MTEEEKLDAGLYYDFWDKGVNGRKLDAIKFLVFVTALIYPPAGR